MLTNILKYVNLDNILYLNGVGRWASTAPLDFQILEKLLECVCIWRKSEREEKNTKCIQ